MSAQFVCPPTIQQLKQAIFLASKAKSIEQIISPCAWEEIKIDTGQYSEENWVFNSPTEKSKIIFSTSGSSGQAKFIPLSFEDMEANCRIHGFGYASAGISKNDRVATWGSPGIMSSEFTVYLALKETGASIFPIGDFSDCGQVVDILARFQVNVLLLMPSDLLVLARYLIHNQKRLSQIRLVVYGGEPLRSSELAVFEKAFGEQIVFRGVYQSSDCGSMGYQCPSCEPNHFHIHHESQLVEILDADENGWGRITTTNLLRNLNPVVRRETGDSGRVAKLHCDPSVGMGIEIRGRLGNLVKLGGEKFSLDWIEKVKEMLSISKDELLVELHRDQNSGEYFVFVNDRLALDDDAQQKVCESFRSSQPQIPRQIHAGTVSCPRFLTMGEKIIQKTKSGKIISFIDVRE